MSLVAPAGPTALLVARDIAKAFGPTRALAAADLIVHEREIHALVGTSGAGKSTLLAILSGLDTVDHGEIVFRGYPIKLRSRRDAFRIGIAIVAQEPTLVPDLTVLDNLVMPTWGRLGRPEPPDLRMRAGAILSSLGYASPPALDAKARHLSATQARLVEIARALVVRAKLYIFDEPFASLASREIDTLAGVMARLRLSGCGILVATRTPADVLTMADRVTVLCDGRTTLAGEPTGACQPDRVRGAMGVAEAPARPMAGSPVPAPRLVVRDLVALPEVRAVSLAVAGGEIRALHGLKGAGLTALLDTMVGLRRRMGGTVAIDGVPLPPAAVGAATAMGLAIVTAGDALPLPRGTARDNLGLRDHGPGEPWPLHELWRLLDLPMGCLDAPVTGQPAGVRRRIALACGLLAGSAALLLDEPMRGLTLPERTAVHAALRAAAARGCAVVATWSDPHDLLGLSDSVTAVCEGRSVGDLPTALLDAEGLALLASPAVAIARNTSVLKDLTRENGGAAFWALRRDTHLLCLNTAIADAAADPGLAAGRAYLFDQTRIPQALAEGGTDFVAEPDGRRTTVLVPIRTRRGKPMGLIGLTLATDARPPPAAAIAFHIETLAATL